MPARPPNAFPLDDRRIYDFYIAGRASAALAVGVHTGIFDLLDERPLSAEAIAAQLGYGTRPVRLLLAALRAMGLVVPEAEGFGLAPDAAAYLVRGKPGWLGGLIALEVDHFLGPRLLLDALERDAASIYGEQDPWALHEADPVQARVFTEAMHSVSERPAAALAETLDVRGVARLLDVGGGSGVHAVALAERWPDLRCTVLEIASVCALAEETIAARGLGDRVDTLVGDMFRPFPPGYDAVLFSQILHDWSPERGLELVRNAFDALSPGGLVLVHEKLVRDDGSGPLANALVNLDMLVWTEGQQWTEAGLRELVSSAGFTDFRCQPTTGYWSVVSAMRPE